MGTGEGCSTRTVKRERELLIEGYSTVKRERELLMALKKLKKLKKLNLAALNLQLPGAAMETTSRVLDRAGTRRCATPLRLFGLLERRRPRFSSAARLWELRAWPRRLDKGVEFHERDRELCHLSRQQGTAVVHFEQVGGPRPRVQFHTRAPTGVGDAGWVHEQLELAGWVQDGKLRRLHVARALDGEAPLPQQGFVRGTQRRGAVPNERG